MNQISTLSFLAGPAPAGSPSERSDDSHPSLPLDGQFYESLGKVTIAAIEGILR